MKLKSRQDYRRKRHDRVRRKVNGSSTRPRMSIMRSNRYLYVQFIDDVAQRTLAAVTTLGHEGGCDAEAARSLGRRAAEVALGRGIRNVVVDRGGFKFHGRIKALVDAALESGLKAGPDGVADQDKEAT